MAGKSQEILDMEQARKAYKKARKNYRKANGDAADSLKKAQKGHGKDVRNAEQLLEGEQRRIARPIATFAGTKLYWNHIEEGKSSLALEEGMSVEVNASGNTYTVVAKPSGVEVLSDSPIKVDTSRRVDDDGAVVSPHDSGNLFITLKTSVNAMTIQCDPTKGKETRDYADTIAAAASRLTQQAEENRSRLSDAHEHIAASRGDTGDIDQARSTVANTKAATQNVDEAKQYYEDALARVPAAELSAYKKRRLKNRVIAVVVVIVIVLIIAAVLYFRFR